MSRSVARVLLHSVTLKHQCPRIPRGVHGATGPTPSSRDQLTLPSSQWYHQHYCSPFRYSTWPAQSRVSGFVLSTVCVTCSLLVCTAPPFQLTIVLQLCFKCLRKHCGHGYWFCIICACTVQLVVNYFNAFSLVHRRCARFSKTHSKIWNWILKSVPWKSIKYKYKSYICNRLDHSIHISFIYCSYANDSTHFFNFSMFYWWFVIVCSIRLIVITRNILKIWQHSILIEIS